MADPLLHVVSSILSALTSVAKLSTMAKAIGVDIGGTGIKAGLVDLEHGIMASDRVRACPLPRAHLRRMSSRRCRRC